MEKSQFSIAVEGDSPLLGAFLTEAFAHFPNAIWYDRSDQTDSAIRTEVLLGMFGFLRPADQAAARAAAEALDNPEPVDVTVTFTKSGYNTLIDVEGRRRPRSLSINTADLTFEKLDDAAVRIIDAVHSVL
ncbi:MAG: hypothetical protein AAGL24_08375 [Pseudomonadota bacterium]